MFPTYGAEVYYNESGEVLGWDYPSYEADPEFCDDCGGMHATSNCPAYDDPDLED